MKELWFNYLRDNKRYWSHGFTPNRLLKVRPHVLDDADIMWDVLIRHSGKDFSPEEMKAKDIANFQHCIGNFSCSILYKMIELKIYKQK